MGHRYWCEVIKPEHGWRPRLNIAEVELMESLADGGRLALSTRGVYFHEIRAEARRPHVEGEFRWIHGRPEWAHLWGDYTVYIDGSAFYNNFRDITRFGFSVAVVDDCNAVGAVGVGVPPENVDDSAAAELWALMKS